MRPEPVEGIELAPCQRSCTGPPSRQRVDRSGKCQDCAGDRQRNARGEPEKAEAVRDHRDEQRADRRLSEAAPTTKEAYTADDCRGNTG